jgi:hypothetical protein
MDNDGDNFTDCDDFDCKGTVTCASPENSDALCSDGMDNDTDTIDGMDLMLVDCEDPSCHGHPDVTVCMEGMTPAECTDNQDNDQDGYTDCDDKDCVVALLCDATQETGMVECTDTLDNDMDGDADCADNSCRWTYEAGCKETICDDNISNDGDNFVDCDDFDCKYSETFSCPNIEVTDADCSDGEDQDNNGFADCEDFSCQQSPLVTTACEGNAVTCADGIDNDMNGFTDCEDFSCRYCGGQNPDVVATCPGCN